MDLFDLDLGFNPQTIGIGALAVFLGPTLLSAAGSIARPMIKAGIKGGLMMYGMSREIISEARETMEDLTAEAKAELSESNKSKAAPKSKAAAK